MPWGGLGSTRAAKRIGAWTASASVASAGTAAAAVCRAAASQALSTVETNGVTRRPVPGHLASGSPQVVYQLSNRPDGSWRGSELSVAKRAVSRCRHSVSSMSPRSRAHTTLQRYPAMLLGDVCGASEVGLRSAATASAGSGDGSTSDRRPVQVSRAQRCSTASGLERAGAGCAQPGEDVLDRLVGAHVDVPHWPLHRFAHHTFGVGIERDRRPHRGSVASRPAMRRHQAAVAPDLLSPYLPGVAVTFTPGRERQVGMLERVLVGVAGPMPDPCPRRWSPQA